MAADGLQRWTPNRVLFPVGRQTWPQIRVPAMLKFQMISPSPDTSSAGFQRDSRFRVRHTFSCQRGLLPEGTERFKNHCPAVKIPRQTPARLTWGQHSWVCSLPSGCQQSSLCSATLWEEEELTSPGQGACSVDTLDTPPLTSQVLPFS